MTGMIRPCTLTTPNTSGGASGSGVSSTAKHPIHVRQLQAEALSVQ